MSVYPSTISRCQHIKTNGTQCGSPALHRRKFCFFHQQWREQKINLRARPRRKSVIQLPVLEDANAVQTALNQVVVLILSKQIDSKDAGLLLYALQTASNNLKRTDFEPRIRENCIIDPRDAADAILGDYLWDPEDFEEDEDFEEEEEEVEAAEATPLTPEQQQQEQLQRKKQERERLIQEDIRRCRSLGQLSEFDPEYKKYHDDDDDYEAPLPTVPQTPTVPQVRERSSGANLGNSLTTSENTSTASTDTPPLPQPAPPPPKLPQSVPDLYKDHPLRIAMRENPKFRVAVARYFGRSVKDKFLDRLIPHNLPQSDLDRLCAPFGFRFSFQKVRK